MDVKKVRGIFGVLESVNRGSDVDGALYQSLRIYVQCRIVSYVSTEQPRSRTVVTKVIKFLPNLPISFAFETKNDEIWSEKRV